MKEKKARVEDAMHATKAAVEEGIVPGGGVALLRASAVLQTLDARGRPAGRRQDRARAIEEPLRCIAANAGHETAIVVERVKGDEGRHGLQRADRRSTRTSSTPASSIRPRSFASRCRTPRLSRRCCSPRKPPSPRFLERARVWRNWRTSSPQPLSRDVVGELALVVHSHAERKAVVGPEHEACRPDLLPVWREEGAARRPVDGSRSPPAARASCTSLSEAITRKAP